MYYLPELVCGQDTHLLLGVMEGWGAHTVNVSGAKHLYLNISHSRNPYKFHD